MLVELAINISVTTLDAAGTQQCIGKALDIGVSGEQIFEVIVLVSALGTHSLMLGAPLLLEALRGRGIETANALDEEQLRLRDKFIGEDRYWITFEKEVPDFLDALLRLSPETFEGFFQYCALPWKNGALSVLAKELISFAVDAVVTHRFLPGLRLHLENSIKLGAGRDAISQILEIAAAGPEHSGVRSRYP